MRLSVPIEGVGAGDVRVDSRARLAIAIPAVAVHVVPIREDVSQVSKICRKDLLGEEAHVVTLSADDVRQLTADRTKPELGSALRSSTPFIYRTLSYGE